MADVKISALTAATTPLAGTEVLPIVQNGVTKKVSVADLTAGRSVSTADLYSVKTSAGAVVDVATVQNLSNTAGTEAALFFAPTAATGNIRGARISAVNDGNNVISIKVYTGTGAAITAKYEFTDDGNIKQLVANKGINFTANTPAAGMTSQLLNWYEEGTWTPTQGAGLTVVGAFSSTGRYTRIGRQVTVSGTVTGATSVAVTAAGIITTNLPFTVVTAGHGNATNAAVNASAAVICTTTNVTSASAIAATGTITFSATYFV